MAADSDGVAGVTAADVKAGDKVLVQARLPRGTKAPAPAAPDEAPVEAAASEEPVADEAPAAIVARKLVVLTRPAAPEDGGSPRRRRPPRKPELEGDDPAARLVRAAVRSRPAPSAARSRSVSSREVRACRVPGDEHGAALGRDGAVGALDPLLERHALGADRPTRVTTSIHSWSRRTSLR